MPPDFNGRWLFLGKKKVLKAGGRRSWLCNVQHFDPVFCAAVPASDVIPKWRVDCTVMQLGSHR